MTVPIVMSLIGLAVIAFLIGFQVGSRTALWAMREALAAQFANQALQAVAPAEGAAGCRGAHV